jgi:hypothetical protein
MPELRKGEHIGGYRACSLPHPVTLRDDAPNGGLLQIGGTYASGATLGVHKE